jgi:phage shock protein A
MGDVGLAMQRAEDKVAQMQSRAGALDELMASGALDNLSQTSDRLEAELNRTSSDSLVEAELTRIRGELGGPTTAKQLGAPTEKADAAPAEEPRQAEETQSAPAQEDQR